MPGKIPEHPQPAKNAFKNSIDSIDINRYVSDDSYRASVIRSFEALETNPNDEKKIVQLIQLLSSDALPIEYQYQLAFIASKYKVCPASPSLIRLLGKQTSIILEPEYGKASPEEALIKLGDCAAPYIKDYLIHGADYPVKRIAAQIMWHYEGSNKKLLKVLKSIKKECRTRENAIHIEKIIDALKSKDR